jgi:hypothetical protein
MSLFPLLVSPLAIAVAVYFFVRFAVKHGVRSAVRDILADPATRLAVLDIAEAVTGERERV